MDKNITKPTDVFLEEEGNLLKEKIVNAVKESTLPLYVRKLVLTQATEDMLSILNQNIQAESQKYYQDLANANYLDNNSNQSES